MNKCSYAARERYTLSHLHQHVIITRIKCRKRVERVAAAVASSRRGRYPACFDAHVNHSFFLSTCSFLWDRLLILYDGLLHEEEEEEEEKGWIGSLVGWLEGGNNNNNKRKRKRNNNNILRRKREMFSLTVHAHSAQYSQYSIRWGEEGARDLSGGLLSSREILNDGTQHATTTCSAPIVGSLLLLLHTLHIKYGTAVCSKCVPRPYFWSSFSFSLKKKKKK